MIPYRHQPFIRQIPRLHAVRAGSRLGIRLDAEPGTSPTEPAVLLIERAGRVIETVVGIQPVVRPGRDRKRANKFIIPRRNASHDRRRRLDPSRLRRVQLHRPNLVAMLIQQLAFTKPIEYMNLRRALGLGHQTKLGSQIDNIHPRVAT